MHAPPHTIHTAAAESCNAFMLTKDEELRSFCTTSTQHALSCERCLLKLAFVPGQEVMCVMQTGRKLG